MYNAGCIKKGKFAKYEERGIEDPRITFMDGVYYILFTAVSAFEIGSIWISYSDDLIYWGHSKALITPRPGYWDSYRIGASVPPIKTDKGGWRSITV
jgi:predicted GH43/DUF377 family glycosyl hydrolase